MNLVKTIATLVFLLVSMAAQAGSAFSRTKIQGVVIHDFGNQILVNLPAAVTNSESCQFNNQLVIEKTHPFFKELYSALLATYQANGDIAGWVHGCNTTFKAPVLIRLDLVR